MCESIECIDYLLHEVVHLRPPRFQVRLFVRKKIYDELMGFLERKRLSRMVTIAAFVYQNRYRDDIYRKERSDPDVTAMKFTDRGRNDRLYCREILSESGKDVIICEIHDKKSQKNKNKENNIIKRCGTYEFELFT